MLTSEGNRITRKFIELVESLALALSTTFGKGFFRAGKFSRIFVFLSCLTGSFLFMAYKASLTSKLAIKRMELPFRNMQELLDSDYDLPGYSKLR